MPNSGQFHISNSAQFRSRIDDAETQARLHSQYRWAQWTDDISNMFDEMNHDAILKSVWWALNSVAMTLWNSNTYTTRRVDRFSVARYGKGAHADWMRLYRGGDGDDDS